jgi:competence protein ComEC
MFRRAREAICTRIDVLFGEHAPLFRAVMLGEKGEMNEDVAEAMSMSGTAHILAVSGMHVGLLAGAIAILLDMLPIGGKMRFLITAARFPLKSDLATLHKLRRKV